MSTIEYQVGGLTCASCIVEILDHVRGVPGVTKVSVDLARGGSSSVMVTADRGSSGDEVRQAVRDAGFELFEDSAARAVPGPRAQASLAGGAS